jgi:hypothetical protein
MAFDFRLTTQILTKDQLASIGSVVVESTYLEGFVESLIWDLSKLTPEQGKFFTHSLGLDSRLDLLASLGKPRIRSAKKKTEFTSLISRLKTVNRERNLIVHGLWETSGAGVLAVICEGPENHAPATAKKRRLNSAESTLSAANIEKTSRRLGEITAELADFSDSWTLFPIAKKSR